MNRPVLHSAQIRDVTFGTNVKIIEPVNLYGCTLENDSFIGPFTEIQQNVHIGKRTRVQSHSFICEGVNIGDDCFIGHGVMFINDDFSIGKPAGDRSLWKLTQIENNVSIGSNATILPVVICEGTVIGAGAVVTKDIRQKGVYAGNPAKLIRVLQ
jgi:acetyltransferase-like isoleucine patch superfamily enzyme